MYYPACTNPNCRRKVMEDGGHYRCENCGKSDSTFDPTYFFTAKICDFSDSFFVSFARE